MGDLNTGEENKVDQAENGGADQEETQTSAGADAESEGDEATDDDNTDSGEEGDKDDESESKPTPIVDEEPKTRKRNVDFILERKNRKIEKLKNKEEEETGEDEDDDDIDPDDAKIIQKQVVKALSPFIAKQMQDEDEQEIASFVKDNPEFVPYLDKVRTFSKHPSRKDLPIQSIFYEVAGPDLLRIGATRAKKANEEAKESSAGGGSSQGDNSEKSVWDLTPEEFTAKQEALRNKPRE